MGLHKHINQYMIEPSSQNKPKKTHIKWKTSYLKNNAVMTMFK